MNTIGIDVSKKKLDVAIRGESVRHYRCFENSKKGFKQLIAWVKKSSSSECMYCLEATGIYSLAICEYLYEQDEKVIQAHAKKVYNFARMQGGKNKTDKADAHLIADYAHYLLHEGKPIRYFKPKDEVIQKLSALNSRRHQLIGMRTQETNYLESAHPSVKSRIHKSLKDLTKKIKEIEGEIEEVIASDKRLSHQYALLLGIPSIGRVCAATLLIHFSCCENFQTSKQASAYAGLNPRNVKSGTSVDRAYLSRSGHKDIRKVLFMAAMSALKNERFRAYYDQLVARGKAGKIALCAIMRRLLVIAFTILKTDKEYDPNHQSMFQQGQATT